MPESVGSVVVNVAEKAAPPVHAGAAEPRRLALNFFYLSAGEMGAKLLTFLSFSYLSRTLGPQYYGFLEFTLAVMIFFALPVDLGLGAYGAREIARNHQRASALLHEITGLRVALAFCSLSAMAVFILLVPKPFEVKLLLSLYSISLLGGPFLMQWFFQAHDAMHWVGMASVVRQAGLAAMVFLFFRRGTPIVWLGVFECISVAAVSLFCFYITKYQMGFDWPKPDLDIPRLIGHIAEAAPIGLTEVAWAFMWYFSTVVLGMVTSDWSLGWFGASHRLLMALHTFVWLYFFNLLPSITRCVAKPREQLLSLMDHSLRISAWAGLFLAGVLTVLAHDALRLVYGYLYGRAASSFSILAWMLPVAMLSGHHRYILIAYKRQQQLLYCTVISAGVAVVLAVTLIPVYRGRGAAWALLISLIVNFLLVYFAVRKHVVEVPVHRQVAMPLIAFGAAAALFLLLVAYNFYAAAAAAAALYIAGLALSPDGRLVSSFIRSFLPGSTSETTL